MKESIVVTGTSKGIGEFLAKRYADKDFKVFGCSRGKSSIDSENYEHFSLDVSDENSVKAMFSKIRKSDTRLVGLINNAGIASMNHFLLTPLKTIEKVYRTNVFGSFLFSREAAKIMKKNGYGRIVNFATVATALKLEGEAAYASSKAAIESLTQTSARELADYGITVNAIGPTPVKTDLIRSVPHEKMQALINRQAIKRYGTFEDVTNAIDFFMRRESDFITGQVIYLGGI